MSEDQSQQKTTEKFVDTRDEMERVTDEAYNTAAAIHAPKTVGEQLATLYLQMTVKHLKNNS